MTFIASLYRNQLWYAGRLLLLPLLLLVVIGWWWRPLWFLATAFFAFLLYFFRVPLRPVSDDATILVSPADGTVVAVEPTWMQGQEFIRISIFLSPLDVHVNWIPVASRITDIVYTPGKFLVAWADKSSEINERLELTLETATGQVVFLRQIAGFVARRIWCIASVGKLMHRGELYGMIRFGSRVDLIVPAATNVLVSVGMRVEGSRTLLGRLPGNRL